MGLNFKGSQVAVGNTGQVATTLNLQKVQQGQMLNLSKEAPNLKNILAKLIWESNAGMVEVDMDISAVLLGIDGRAVKGNLAQDAQKGDTPRALVYYNNEDGTKGVEHGGDIKGGGTEEMSVYLDQLESDVDSVVIVASTHSETNTPVTMGLAKNPTVLIINKDTNEALFQIDLEEEGSISTSVEIVNFSRKNGEFRMKSLGAAVGTSATGLQDIVDRYFDL